METMILDPATFTETGKLGLDTAYARRTKGIPTGCIHPMEHAHIERIAGVRAGEYKKNPERIYLACQHAIGVCILDQYIPDNPLTMGAKGFERSQKEIAAGTAKRMVDGMEIDSPESVAAHLEQVHFPRIRKQIAEFNEEKRAAEIIEGERQIQEALGPSICKTGYGFVKFPTFRYGTYGYEFYFMAYALYPEIMEKCFALEADLYVLQNKAAARACREARLPPLYRLDHDMATSNGMLVDIRSLDKIWFPHFARCLAPMLKTDVRMIWHCDGNLMDMVPRLIEVGIKGFQGFQYEDGMDYEKICSMKTKEGEELFIIAGVSVTTTLPHGTTGDIKKQLRWLVEKGPSTGLALGASSSIAPGVAWENINMLIEGLKYYREHGRGKPGA